MPVTLLRVWVLFTRSAGALGGEPQFSMRVLPNGETKATAHLLGCFPAECEVPPHLGRQYELQPQPGMRHSAGVQYGLRL
jgi:hypothetical protein